MCRDLARMNVFMSFPWILYIGILRYIITFHLNMGRHINILPVFAGIFLCLKSRNSTLIISCILEFPESVQRLTVRRFFIICFLPGCIIYMIRMCIQTTVTEIFRIFYHCIIKLFHRFLLLIKSYSKILDALRIVPYFVLPQFFTYF